MCATLHIFIGRQFCAAILYTFFTQLGGLNQYRQLNLVVTPSGELHTESVRKANA